MSWYRMYRGWMDHEIFSGDAYSERSAWVWLIENAAWEPTKAKIKGAIVEIDEGQLCFAQRFLAEKWGWSKSRVERFLKRLTAAGMIATCSKIGAISGHPAGQGQSIITICNFKKYQGSHIDARGNRGNDAEATAGQQRGKEEELEEFKNKGEGARERAKPAKSYVFEGQVIRLNAADYDKWLAGFHALPDLGAELMSLDAWLMDQPEEKQKRWFIIVTQALNKKHQEIMTLRRETEGQGSPAKGFSTAEYYRQLDAQGGIRRYEH